ncbi:hypothetical protein EV198_0577 [Roseivirga ehrenbergii]|uniref:hypothetical protein n=1 Tax=Roseivirga ehrenbergii (strain DSM 102268 / JCM 13514 / KCTC 12282 / NCIMB 14502 / KMM 6017) TaxID=279360 RepID=UPI000A59C3FB|nr:hypothetical protein [Roseivirga ehrenbergii]TCL13747.1 hypothetical protein EV198_0577 [Roseivirga ehrenbergii]
MRANSRIDILRSPLFLLGLAILLLNDFVLKYEYSNVLTGKLSDFTGLFIFPIFFSALFPKYTRIIYGLTILIFGYWNSSISQGLINFLNNSAIHVGRTVDPTDFLAFSVMPFSFIYFKSQIARLRRRIIIPTGTVIGAVAVFSFVATTLPKQSAELGIGSNKTYTLELDKTEFFGKLQPGYLLSDTIELNLVDSLFYLYYYVPDIRADMFVLANITEQDDKTIIRLDNFLTGSVTGSLFSGVDEDDLRAVEKVNKSEHEEFFQKYFIGQLLKPTNESRGLYYNNKNIYDEIQRRYE